MKGSPIRDALILLIISLGLLVPLLGLSRRPVFLPESKSSSPSDLQQVDAWLEARFSHPPLSAEVRQGDTLLWQAGGEAREDAELRYSSEQGEAELRVMVAWEPGTEAYAEFRIEPEGKATQTLGGWSREGNLYRRWRLQKNNH